MKNARKKLETPVAPAMPSKISKKNKHGETRSKTNDFKSQFACIHENAYGRISTEITMRTVLQEKETIHCSIAIWYTNLFLCLKQWKFPQQKQQWLKSGKVGKDSGVVLDESQK